MEAMYEFICPDKTFKMSSVYVDSDHNVGTIFQKTFGGEFMKESSLFVPFGKEIFTLVLPMIRDGTIYVPEPKQLVELAALLRFLAGENPHWEKVANLFSGSFILDPYSRLICLYSPTVVGRFLDITTSTSTIRPPAPLKSSIAPIRSGATSCTLRLKKARVRRFCMRPTLQGQ